jgi:5-methyltetrahydrofolate--homocysteine methyltransferase
MEKILNIAELAKKRVLILDGAMGTAIQQRNLAPEDYYYPEPTPASRSFSEGLVPGCNEVLSLSRPDVIEAIHSAYIDAGADIIETNTFSGNAFALKDYGLADKVYEINAAAVKVAKQAIAKADRPVFLAASIGPTGRSASFSPSVDDPAYRESDFHDFVAMYRDQLKPLLDGGVDLILVETIFDTLVAKAALTAIKAEFDERGIDLPVMVSATFSDKSRRTLSGQSLQAFIASLSSYNIFSLGVNCSTGAAEMIPLIRDLAKWSPFRTSAHPNAGFPDHDGNYTQDAEELAALLKPVLDEGLLNIVGGCCGTRPVHIKAIAEAAKTAVPRPLKTPEPVLSLSAWDTLNIPPKHQFITVGERANVAGSRKFARLIKEEKYEEAIALTRKQVDAGAQIIDVCMDDPMIDAPAAMKKFLRLVAADPVTARVPVMIDSSAWEVIETALPELQGRGIVNSISLKEGEAEFLRRAKHIHAMGAAVMVMLFDEHGQAESFSRKCSVAERAYRLLTEKTDITPESIIFDPNILSIATGIDEHDLYARDFIRAVKWIKGKFPAVKVSGGLSNLSFAFRGNNPLRKAMHTIFLELAVEAGLDMAIVNPAMEMSTAGIPGHAKAIIKEALLVENGDGVAARKALIDLAMSDSLTDARPHTPEAKIDSWREEDVSERLALSMVRGDDSYLEADLSEAGLENALALVEGPLMGGMSRVGELFGEGKVFLPQVVRSARIMKKAVDILRPYLVEADESTQNSRGTVVLATVKGDVHDIGKNIVSLVLQCNHFTVIDLGVMVPPEDIFKAAVEHKADMVGLSGLITPSLVEMGEVCRIFNDAGLDIPILIGGATTSEAHTATRLAPLYPGHVVYSSDASDSVRVALELVSANAKKFLKKTQKHYSDTSVSSNRRQTGKELISLEKARKLKHKKLKSSDAPTFLGKKVIRNFDLNTLLGLINWKMFALAWQVRPNTDEAEKLRKDAEELLAKAEVQKAFESSMCAVVGLYEAKPDGDDILLNNDNARLYFLRKQQAIEKEAKLSLSDYVHERGDHMGLFVATTGSGAKKLADTYRDAGDDYHALMINLLADRLAEALSEYLNIKMQDNWWKQSEHKIIRPASGYPSAPDHSEKAAIFNILNAEKELGVTLTESYAMDPVSSVCGYYFADVKPYYFSLGDISEEQFEDYANRKGMEAEALKKVYAGKLR